MQCSYTNDSKLLVHSTIKALLHVAVLGVFTLLDQGTIWSSASGLVGVGVPVCSAAVVSLPSTGCAFYLCLQVSGPPHNMHWSGVLGHRSSTMVSTASPLNVVRYVFAGGWYAFARSWL